MVLALARDSQGFATDWEILDRLARAQRCLGDDGDDAGALGNLGLLAQWEDNSRGHRKAKPVPFKAFRNLYKLKESHSIMNDKHLRVGVVGIGVMGSAIATRLLERGHRLWLRDPDPAKTAPLVAKGAVAAASAAALTSEVDYVITSLNTAEIVERVVFSPDGIAGDAASDALLIDMSSIDPKATAIMAARLEKETGMAWVDAPLSGGAPAALKGQLTLMLGGTDAAVERARLVLTELATNITHMGASGAGQTTKLINQVLCACNFLSVAEATRLAVDGGVDPRRIPAALAGGRADSRILQEFMPKMAIFDYSPTGRIDNMLKDLEAVQRYAMALRTPMPLTGLVTELHRIMVAAGIGPEDSAAYMKLFDFGRGSSAAVTG